MMKSFANMEVRNPSPLQLNYGHTNKVYHSIYYYNIVIFFPKKEIMGLFHNNDTNGFFLSVLTYPLCHVCMT